MLETDDEKHALLIVAVLFGHAFLSTGCERVNEKYCFDVAEKFLTEWKRRYAQAE